MSVGVLVVRRWIFMSYLIKNAMIVDGTGAAPYRGDCLIMDGKIAGINKPVLNSDQPTLIDAAGRYLTPGFIDIHRHADNAVFRPDFGEAELRQGLTTIINGNCGLSVVPCPKPYGDEIRSFLTSVNGEYPKDKSFSGFSDYLDAIPEKLPLNVGMLIGNGTVRSAVAGYKSEPLSDEEMSKVHELLTDAIDSGAFGVSIGLQYAPEMYYGTDELIRALEPMRGRNVPLCTHTRGDGDTMLESISEVIRIAETLDILLEISHFKNMGRVHWGPRTLEGLRLIDEARARGVKVNTDVYPYTYGSTQFVQILPPSYLDGGMHKLAERLRDKSMREKLRDIIEKGRVPENEEFENYVQLLGWESFYLTSFASEKNSKYTGMSVPDIASARGTSCFDAACDLIAEEEGRITMMDYLVSDADIDTVLRHERSMIISDAIYPSSGNPHPRVYGTFARILAEYVRDRKVMDIQTAVRKMSGFPAETFGIRGKGFVKEGCDADLCLFDIGRIKDFADMYDPKRFAEGFDYVFVGGEPAVINDKMTGSREGRVLRKR